MHMGDALLSPAVGLSMWAVSAAAIGITARKMREDSDLEDRTPLLAVMGAFVFAAQMINFTIPGTGSSGHIGGGLLLAAVLGGYPAYLAVTAVLTIQCLFFADGGLLALGCNSFNLGIIPCLVVYPLVYKPLAAREGRWSIEIAALLSAVIALQTGALAVVLQTWASGVALLPISKFLLLMQPIHLAIGLAEGAITALTLRFVESTRPELLTGHPAPSWRKTALSVLLVALLVAGALSHLASSHPDGLEWSIERAAGGEAISDESAPLPTAILPEYDFADRDSPRLGRTASGVAGSVIVCGALAAAAFSLTHFKKRTARG